MLEFVIRATAMFLTGFVTDVFWALYIKYVGDANKMKSALYSVATGMCTIVFIENTITSIWLTPFWLFGLAIGTYYSTDIESWILRHYKGKIL